MGLTEAPPRLLAKSTATPDWPGEAVTLVGHTAAVLSAASALTELVIGPSLKAAGLPARFEDRLARILMVSAWAHDLGKANSHFQAMLRGQFAGQLVRHEGVSAWLAWQEPLHSWLSGALADPSDLPLAIAAVAGHHRKFEAQTVACQNAGLGTSVMVWSGHQDVSDMLTLGSKALDLTPPPRLADKRLVLGLGGGRALFKPLRQAVTERIHQDPDSLKLLALAKALLLDADVAGSALPKVANSENWIRKSLADRASSQALLEVVSKRLGRLPDESDERGLFQCRVAKASSPLTLLTAGCGSGKTVAAYLWAATQHAGKQLWITYPTTGTATEGFRDYLHGVDELSAALEHGRSAIDLELLGLDEQADDENLRRDEERLVSLRAWNRHVISCTIDTVLGLIQNQRKGLYAWAGLADSAVVFDEIHAYDDRLFGCLLRFLDALPGIPALLMTASLTEPRRVALDQLSRNRHGIPLEVIEGPRSLEELPRYSLTRGEDPWPLVKSTLQAGGKVLWVANTVDRCLKAADRAEDLGWSPLVYHSRFRYMDRVNRHKDVIAAFKQSKGCFAVTTQVAEMSLDLSADLLVTELAPVSALIQRLGRLNRRSTPENPQPVKTALILDPQNHLPYEESALEEAMVWLEAMGKGDLSQRDLVAAWTPSTGKVEAVRSEWLDGGLDTEPREVREGSPGITVLLSPDAEAVQNDSAQASAYALPMPPPKGNGWLGWPRLAHYPVAPPEAIHYDPNRGARWEK